MKCDECRKWQSGETPKKCARLKIELRPGTLSDFKWFHLYAPLCLCGCCLYFVLCFGFMYHICMCIKHSVASYVRGINAYKLNLYMLIHYLVYTCPYANVTAAAAVLVVLLLSCADLGRIVRLSNSYWNQLVNSLMLNGRGEHIECTSFGNVSYHLDFIASQTKTWRRIGR